MNVETLYGLMLARFAAGKFRQVEAQLIGGEADLLSGWVLCKPFLPAISESATITSDRANGKRWLVMRGIYGYFLFTQRRAVIQNWNIISRKWEIAI